MNDLEKKQILKKVNSEIKCVYLSARGVKVYNKAIDIASIIRVKSRQVSIAWKENFKLFDFEIAIKLLNDEYDEKIKNIEDDKKLKLELKKECDEKLKKIKGYEEEYKKLEKICTKANSIIDNIKSTYSGEFFGTTKLVLEEDLIAIENKINEFKVDNINKVILNDCINFFKITLDKNIRNVLKRHQVEYDPDGKGETNEEIENKITEKLKSIPDADNMINGIEPKLVYVLNVSEQTINDKDSRNKIIKFLEDKEKLDLIEEINLFVDLK